MRLFIAVTMPEELKERIAHIQSGLKRVSADVKWVPQENFHLTLKFLGEVAEDKIPALEKDLRTSIENAKPFVLSLTGLGGFPSSRHPRVVWAGVREGSERLAEIAGSIDEAMAVHDFPKEERAFSSHITLGRVRSGKNRERLGVAIEAHREAEIGSFTVKSIELMQSFLSPHGPRYSCLKSILI